VPRIEPRELPHLGVVGNFVAGIVQRMGASEGVTFEESKQEDDILISASGAGISDLLGRDPGVASAISHLASRAATRHTDPGVRIRVDFGGTVSEVELEPEEEQLLADARELAEGVRRSGEPGETGPLSSRERWLVHNALREVDGVSSESAGEGDRKRVRVLPA
jgi:spoIIIJ-associated protein